MPPLSIDIQRLAELALLDLSPREIDRFKYDLAAILQCFSQIQKIDKTLEAADGDSDFICPLRSDTVGKSLKWADALANAPEQDGEFVLVPRILP